MNAGKLRKRFTIQKPTTSTDADSGEVTNSFTSCGMTWGEFIPQGSREYQAISAMWAEATHALRIRYRSTIDGSYRFTYDNRTFEIVSIANEDEADRYLIITLMELL